MERETERDLQFAGTFGYIRSVPKLLSSEPLSENYNKTVCRKQIQENVISASTS